MTCSGAVQRCHRRNPCNSVCRFRIAAGSGALLLVWDRTLLCAVGHHRRLLWRHRSAGPGCEHVSRTIRVVGLAERYERGVSAVRVFACAGRRHLHVGTPPRSRGAAMPLPDGAAAVASPRSHHNRRPHACAVTGKACMLYMRRHATAGRGLMATPPSTGRVVANFCTVYCACRTCRFLPPMPAGVEYRHSHRKSERAHQLLLRWGLRVELGLAGLHV